jgi:hypothetical protein
VRIPRDANGQNLRGIAFIDCESTQVAEACLKLNSSKIRGQPVQIYLSKPPAESSVEI